MSMTMANKRIFIILVENFLVFSGFQDIFRMIFMSDLKLIVAETSRSEIG